MIMRCRPKVISGKKLCYWRPQTLKGKENIDPTLVSFACRQKKYPKRSWRNRRLWQEKNDPNCVSWSFQKEADRLIDTFIDNNPIRRLLMTLKRRNRGQRDRMRARFVPLFVEARV